MRSGATTWRGLYIKSRIKGITHIYLNEKKAGQGEWAFASQILDEKDSGKDDDQRS